MVEYCQGTVFVCLPARTFSKQQLNIIGIDFFNIETIVFKNISSTFVSASDITSGNIVYRDNEQ